MHVLINALYLRPGRVGGTETYLRGLVAGLHEVDDENNYTLCVSQDAAHTFPTLGKRWKLRVAPIAAASRAARLLVEQTWVPRIASSLRCDVIHSAGYTAPLVSRAA